MVYILKLQKFSGNHLQGNRAGANNAENLALSGRVNVDDISMCVPHYTPNKSSQKILLGHIVSKAPTELSYKKVHIL